MSDQRRKTGMFPTEADRERFRGFLCGLSRRPRMYTPHGTLAEVALFVEGFMFGVGWPRGEINNECGLLPFARWLSDGSRVPGNWHTVLLDYCEGDELDAVARLGTLYSAYLDEN